MNRFFIALLLVFMSFSASAQQAQTTAEKDFMTYSELLANKQWTQAVEYLNPGLFTLIPKEGMVQVFEQTFNNPEMQIVMGTPKITQVGPTQSLEGKHFLIISYDNYMKIKMIYQAGEKSANDAIFEVYKTNYGSDNVSFDEVNSEFTIQLKQKVVAVSQDGKSQWKFLEYNPNQKEMLKQFIPEALLKQLD